MNTGLRVEFTVSRERARRAAIVKRALRATPANPAVILCPQASVARGIERAIARDGAGAFALTVDWSRLLDALERASGLEGREAPHEATRVAWVEAALEAMRRDDPALAAALSVDPSAVARALVRSVDLVRSAGWLGETAVIERACATLEPAVAAPVRVHLALIAAGASAIERGLEETRSLDHVGRVTRWVRAEEKIVPRAWREVVVEGVDLLSPIERALLEALIANGVRVDVAPWVWGWNRPASRPMDDPDPPVNALDALARFPLGEQTDREDDASVIECYARDPDDEADAVAEWVASLDPEQRAKVSIAVAGEPGDGPRVLRALERHGVRGAWRGAVRATDVPLWSVVRSCVRLLWRGPDALDLATTLTAPGSGTWGSDRDRIVARLRSSRPARWSDVRATVIDSTDPEQHAFVSSDDDADRRVFDPARAEALETQRRSVLALVSELEGEVPMRELPVDLRVIRVRSLVQSALQRFANPQRIRVSVTDARAAAWWIASANAIREAMRAVLDSVGRDAWVLASNDPTPFLLRVERMLPALHDAVDDRRADRLRVLSDSDFSDERPETLVVLGFVKGRYPAAPASLAWLGATERRALASVADTALSEIPDEGLYAQILARNAHRLLSSPTARLVLVRPHRDAAGATNEPCATRADLLDAFNPSIAEARERRALAHVRAVLAPIRESAARARRALVARMGAGLDEATLAAVERFADEHPSDAALFAARLAPSRDFAIASALRPVLDKPAYSPTDLELATKCAFAFATRSVLGLRWLPLASGPRWGPRALLGAAQRSLRALEASDGDVDRALDVAMEHEDAKGATLETAGARRVLRTFVQRFGVQRKRWKARELAAPPSASTAGREPSAEDAVTIDLGCEHAAAPKSIRVRADVARVESVADGEAQRALVVDLRVGRLVDDQARASLGVGAASAVLPVIASVQYGVAVDAMATVSLDRADTRVVARDGTFGVEPEQDASLTRLATEAKRRFAAVFDRIADGSEPIAPHDHERRAALVDAGIRTCEGCPSRLLCRFDLRGERS